MSDSLEKMTGKKSAKSMIMALFLLAIISVIAIGFFKFYEREKPQISFKGDISTIGLSKEVHFTVSDSRSGIRLVQIVLTQGDKNAKLYSQEFSRLGFFENNGPKRLEETVVLDSGALGFTDGPAELQVTVRDFSFWNWMAGNETFITYPVVMDTHPPKIVVLHSTRYVKPGGSGIVIYKIDDTVQSHGVTVNGHDNPGFPVSDENNNTYIAYFGLPHETENTDGAVVNATDLAGNSGSAAFGMVIKKVNFKHDKINISDNFLNLKLPEFRQVYPQLSGTPVEQFVTVNSKIRQENYEIIVAATSNPSPLRLWYGSFLRMPRTSRMAGFAEYRTYYYNGQEIDQQVHLGIDLASTRRDEVPAANNGTVVFADYLGIYGNTVILDHGQGIFSLYSHLSEINVSVGEQKEKGSLLGLTGATGMAGGDHLHFSVLVNGIFVSPIEWWDEQWLRVNIDDVLIGNAAKNR